MDSKNNVIDLRSRHRRGVKNPKKAVGPQSTTVTDIGRLRKEIIKEERRQVKRTILTEFIGANIVIPGLGLKKVAIYDISPDGIAFDMEIESGQFKSGEEVAMRVYMNQHTYFSFVVRVTHAKVVKEEGVFRHGAEFLKETVNRKALFHFVKFIENVSASLKSDRGDVMVSNIK